MIALSPRSPPDRPGPERRSQRGEYSAAVAELTGVLETTRQELFGAEHFFGICYLDGTLLARSVQGGTIALGFDFIPKIPSDQTDLSRIEHPCSHLLAVIMLPLCE